MAFFGVTIETIDKVWPHTNADRLSMASVKGMAFQFVIGKDQFTPGTKVLYFPLDSILPQALLEKMNMTGKLSGKNRDRIKTAKLRGEISQGLVFPVEKLLSAEQINLNAEEITTLLGVTKYEPPVQMAQDGKLVELPSGFSKYDIEGADRFGHIVDLLMDQDVVITEKMEGTNFSVGKTTEGTVVVNQRNHSIVEHEGVKNSYWEAARNHDLIEVIATLPTLSAIYGELVGPGIQGNLYGLKKHQIFIFDIKEDGKWMGWDRFDSFIKEHNLLTAPLLFKGKLKDFLQGKTVQEMSNGKSVVNPTMLREGIVIKPVVEQWNSQVGRLIIKQRSPEYLADEK